MLRLRRSLAVLAPMVLMLSFAGCADDGVVYDNGTGTPVSGNWQISSSASAKVALPSVSGQLTGAAGRVTGVLHADAATGCATAKDAIAVSGSTDANGMVTLSGAVAGGTLTVSGKVAADGRSLSGATYNVTGGQCAFVQAATATVQNYSSVSGSYNGSFYDPDGRVITLTANLTQSPEGDTTGDFQLSGTATLGQNGCFGNPVTVTSSQVTGGSFTLTYADDTTVNSVTATGTFSTDGKTLTVTNWKLTGACGPDSGNGLLAQQ
jgi:hypothetical protein